ncbi:MAG: pentapeptide repeat-containing protein [Microscillaceae bacterium]|nr:pentapeptide repeat-containing protein [Microscillaceae bacterium]
MDNLECTRLAMKQMVLESQPISIEEFNKVLEAHDTFLLYGGAGGVWETFYIKNMIFGVYRGPNPAQGTQAKLGFHDLREIQLTGIVLPYADCSAILCLDKNWSRADLEGSLFIDSILNNCSFQDSDLYGADFSRSEMKHCNFRGANLLKTDFENCDLSGSDFRGAKIDQSTLFKNAILENVLMD